MTRVAGSDPPVPEPRGNAVSVMLVIAAVVLAADTLATTLALDGRAGTAARRGRGQHR